MFLKGNNSSSKAAEDLGINKNTVCKWVKEYRQEHEMPSYEIERKIKKKSADELAARNKELEKELKRMEKELADEKEKAEKPLSYHHTSHITVNCFLDISEKYTDITELTPELLRTFVNKIVIYEREKKHDKNAPQQIDIYYRYIGSMYAVAERTKENDETESDS